LTYDTNNLPVEPVYVYNIESKKWEQQSFGICTDQADYITRQNPNGPGDTFVDRDKYIKTTKKPFSPSDPDFDPVESPKTGINVVIDPNN
jgi:hypothetical protein